MRQLIVAILLIVAIALQSALRAVWQPLGFIDFALVLVVYFALQREPLLALITAAAAGLALDLISGPPALLGAGGFAKVCLTTLCMLVCIDYLGSVRRCLLCSRCRIS